MVNEPIQAVKKNPPSPRSGALRRYLFRRSAAVLGSSNVSTPKTQECRWFSPALKAAASEDGRTPPNRYLRRAYTLMRRRFGHQNWWPGESPFEVCVGAILTQNTSWTNVERAIDRLKAAGVLEPAKLKHFCRTRKPRCETCPLNPLLPDSK